MVLFGELKRTDSAVAIEDTSVIVITRDTMDNQLDNLPSWFVTMFKALIERLRSTNLRIPVFTFDDLTLLDDRSIQRVIKESDTKDLTISLTATDEELKESILRNMSERAANHIKEEFEFMGPVRLKDVEEAQMKIVDIVQTLEEDGEIVISGLG